MIVRAPTMTELWHASCERLLYVTRDTVDFASAGYTVNYDNILMADSMVFDYDVGLDSWLTMSRWRKLQRDYLDIPEVVPFIERCVDIALDKGRRGVITQMTFKKNVRHHVQKSHVWGNCLMDITYRGGPKFTQPTINVHSRVGFLAFLGGLDLSLVLCLARHIAEGSGQDLADFRLRWYMDSAAHHSFKSVPYIMAHGHYDHVMDEARYPKKQYPALGASRDFIRRFEDHPPEFFKFGQMNRMSKRWQQVFNGPGFPSIHIDDMELLPEILGQEPARKRRSRGVQIAAG